MVRSTHVCQFPTLTAWNRPPGADACPKSCSSTGSLPQQAIEPSKRNAHVWYSPAEMALNSPLGTSDRCPE